MKRIVSLAAAAALMTATLPAWSQTSTTTKSDDQTQNAPGSGGVSKPGVPGHPGNKSGPAAKGAESTTGTESSGSSTPSAVTPSQDSSKVPGLPGGKSGAAERSPGEKSSGSGASDSKSR